MKIYSPKSHSCSKYERPSAKLPNDSLHHHYYDVENEHSSIRFSEGKKG